MYICIYIYIHTYCLTRWPRVRRTQELSVKEAEDEELRAAYTPQTAQHTLHSTPYTLHTTHHILHPPPSALHPTPYILHPRV